MNQNEMELRRIAVINRVSDIKQYRHCKTDGNMLREYIADRKVQCIATGTVSKMKTVVMIIKIAPHILAADYVYEHDSVFDLLIKIIKDLLERHQNIRDFQFNSNLGSCEFMLCENKPGNLELLKIRFADSCLIAGNSGKLYQVAIFANKRWFIHKLPNVNDKINLQTHEGKLADQVSCDCFCYDNEKKCAHKTLATKYLS